MAGRIAKVSLASRCLRVVVAAGAASTLHPSVATAQLPQYRNVPTGLDLYMPVPEGNPLVGNVVALGRMLFFDPILSRDSSLACASCHDPERGFTDGRPVSVGVFGRRGSRNVPAIINRGYGRSFFWDGRISTLEEQVLQPIQASIEMDMTIAEVISRLEHDRDYPALFRSTFGHEPNRKNLARSLAAYVRTIQSGNSPFDRLVDGDRGALSDLEVKGLRLFQARCARCHVGPIFTDEDFHNTGVAWRDGMLSDSGRYVVSGREEHLGAFKTPTLREIARTGPYMHDGSLATLEDVIEFYDRGGNENPYLDRAMRPLNLTDREKQALVAFLCSLSGTVQEGMKEY